MEIINPDWTIKDNISTWIRLSRWSIDLPFIIHCGRNPINKELIKILNSAEMLVLSGWCINPEDDDFDVLNLSWLVKWEIYDVSSSCWCVFSRNPRHIIKKLAEEISSKQEEFAKFIEEAIVVKKKFTFADIWKKSHRQWRIWKFKNIAKNKKK